MPTFTQLQTKVQTRVIDLPLKVKAEIPDLINKAIKDIQGFYNFRVMKTLVEVTTDVTNTDHFFLSCPADWKEPNGQPYWVPQMGKSVPMFWAPDRKFLASYFSEDDDGLPQYLLMGEPDDTNACDIELWPVPDGTSDYNDGEYRIRVPYYRYLPALVNSSDSNWFTSNCEDYIIWQAAGHAFMLDWDSEHAQSAFTLASGFRDAAVKFDRSARFQGATTLAINTNGARRG
jgi:hypothetical protein